MNGSFGNQWLRGGERDLKVVGRLSSVSAVLSPLNFSTELPESDAYPGEIRHPDIILGPFQAR